MKAHQILIWIETSIVCMVWKVNWASFEIKFQKFQSWRCNSVFQESWKNHCISCSIYRWFIHNREQWELHCIHKERVEERLLDDKFGTSSLLFGNWSDTKSKVNIHLPEKVHWITIEQVWHGWVQSYFYSNGIEIEAHIERRDWIWGCNQV